MSKYNLKTVLVAICAAVMAGCASFASEPTINTAESSSDSDVELQAAKWRVSELETELAARDRILRDAEAKMDSSRDTQTSSSLFPPNPKVGECYARVSIPARYETISEQVVSSEASERYEIIPARYETVEEQMLVKAASTRIVETPAEYETITKQNPVTFMP